MAQDEQENVKREAAESAARARKQTEREFWENQRPSPLVEQNLRRLEDEE